jgi:hypothetical protein
MIYCGKAEFGQIPRSFSLNSGNHMKRLALLFFFCVSSQTPAREAQLPDPDTLQRLRANSNPDLHEYTRGENLGGHLLL